jgi:hypothetical protein
VSLLTDDLAAIFTDTSVSVPVEYDVSRPTQTTRGFFSTEDVPDYDASGGMVLVSRRIVTVQDGSLTGLCRNAPITVEAVLYRIHDFRSAGRGKMKIYLAEDKS